MAFCLLTTYTVLAQTTAPWRMTLLLPAKPSALVQTSVWENTNLFTPQTIQYLQTLRVHAQPSPVSRSTVEISPCASLPWYRSHHQVQFLFGLPLYFSSDTLTSMKPKTSLLKSALCPICVYAEDLLEGYFPWCTCGLWRPTL